MQISSRQIYSCAFLALFLLPFWVDTFAVFLYLITGSADLYWWFLQCFDLVPILITLANLRFAHGVLKNIYGWKIGVPAALLVITVFFDIVKGAFNFPFILAVLRYIYWLPFVTVVLLRLNTNNAHAVQSLTYTIGMRKVVGFSSIVIAMLACCQFIFSDGIAESLQTIHSEITPPTKVNAVLTSIAFKKSFASLTLRNPIELGYMGLAMLCYLISRGGSFAQIMPSMIVIVASRSNTVILSVFLLFVIIVFQNESIKNSFKWLAGGLLVPLGLLFTFFLPDIYIREGSSWNDLFEVLSQQRLGMMINLPKIIEKDGLLMLFTGVNGTLADAVSSYYSDGLLPEIFAEGGELAVFDIMWIGYLLVGGLPFVLGSAILLFLGMFRCSRHQSRFSDDLALQLFSVSVFIISFSSQVISSRYGLYFICFFLGAKAVRNYLQSNHLKN